MAGANIPSEVLIQIFSHLDYEDLSSLSQACERFKECAEEFLWQDIELCMGARSLEELGKRDREEASEAGWAAAQRFFTVCCSRRNVGQFVKSLSITVTALDWYSKSGVYSHLLEYLPSLQMILMDPPPRRLGMPSSTQLQFAGCNFRNFDQLRRSCNPSDEAITAHDVLWEIASLPSLHVMQIEETDSGLPLYGNSTHLLEDRRGFSSVQDLRFIWCWPASAMTIPDILLWPKRLKRCILEIPPANIRDAERLLPALEAHAASLEKLVIFGPQYNQRSHSTGYMAAARNEEIGRALMTWSFRKFTALKQLGLPSCPFMSRKHLRSTLPPDLEMLQVHYMPVTRYEDPFWEEEASAIEADLEDDWEEERWRWIFTRFEDIANSKHASLPALKNILLWTSSTSGSWEGDPPPPMVDIAGIARISEIFNRVGVKFEWLEAEGLEDTPLGEALREWH
ncbi:MAG: hypothetical protein Q9163_005280 [Psora crenata]